ncbi:hypothetical protein [uncultured Tateyamaria sp.]|uniref:hypothetical protein n=1 Tax=uncultured Tateyamaria sp. TaxID=455651 RepID=UPI00261E7932|nr:hypothetical protein [uncultured Tateyamaria sp.]
MMDLSQLQHMADLKFRQSEQAVLRLTRREVSLRTELARLQELAHATHCQSASDEELRAIGGDIIWLKWLSSSRRQLNIELAQILAQKEALMAQHYLVNGKKMVADELSKKNQLVEQGRRATSALNQAVETSLVQSTFSNPGGQSQQ